ncbi:MAG: TolC family protein [Opitutales bacterium]|nr:TolC family protein [Opitutales bacterium]
MKRLLISLTVAMSAWAQPETVDPELPDTLDLETALEFALDNNLSILQAREQIREQDGLITEVRSVLVPNISMSASYKVLDDDLVGIDQDDESWAVSIGARQTLYGGGGLRAAVRAQRSLEEAAVFQLESIVNSVILDVTVRFYDVLLARDSIEVEEQNVELLEEQLQNVRNRFEAGTVSQFEVLQAEVTLANAQPALIRAKNNFRVAADELRRATGYINISPNNLTRVPEFIGDLVYMPVDADLVPALEAALSNRPELKSLENLLTANTERVAIARSDRRPDIALVGSYDVRRSGEASGTFDDPDHGWIVGIQSSWNIWDGNATRGRIVQARSQVRQAELSLEQSQLDIEVEVRRALSGLQEADELAQAAAKVIDQAEEALRLAQVRYDSGTSTYLDLLQAQVALTQARNNQLRANYSHQVARAQLDRATGVRVQ